MANYLTTAAASTTYLTISTATYTYQTISNMSNYLTTATATATYQTIANMSNYLTTSTASSTYAPLASPTFTGTITGPIHNATTALQVNGTNINTIYQTNKVMPIAMPA